MNFLRTLFGRKKTKKTVLHSDTALRSEPIGKYDDIAKTIVDGWSNTPEAAENNRRVKRFCELIEAGDTDAAYAALDEGNAKTSSGDAASGDVFVSLTDAKTVALGVGGLFQDTKGESRVFLDVQVLVDPRTGKTSLCSVGPDGIASELDGFMKDQRKTYVLRIARENLEYLKLNRQIWGRVKNVT
jgi:hypothetical protein